MSDQRDTHAKFRDVFRVGEFQALWSALLLSIVGDQLARVALALLVFARTNSAALAALTYALTLLPDLVGGPLLSGLADRFPRREVMVVADLSRAGLVALMAIPGMPLALVCVLLVVVQLLASPFNAARGALLPAMLGGDTFVAGQAVVNITYQSGQLFGYVTGGVVVAFTGPYVALLIDAGTFVASAILVRLGTSARPPSHNGDGLPASHAKAAISTLRAGADLVWRDRNLRALVGIASICGFYVIGEGLAVPYAHELGGGALTAGLLFAAFPAGNALGMVLLLRLVPPRPRLRLLGPMAIAACAVLLICLVHPNLVGTLVILAASGAAASHQTVAAAAFVRAVPDASRGQAYGLANTSIRVAQGLGVVLAGLAAQGLAPSTVVGVFGGIGVLVAMAAAAAYHRARHAVSIRPVEA
ncbi:MAG TPA: MFS transporter [Pseudonocardiaceae bacterium]|nr:MFS transporter [Pseudonocardiaceae bacterium]